MKRQLFMFVTLVAVLVLTGSIGAVAQGTPNRAVAITIDDLPSNTNLNAAQITAMTTKLLTTLRDQKVPAVGFVNEKKLYVPGEVDERIAALKMWLDYGFELGNHTYSHMSLNRGPGLQAWEEDVIRGETVTSLLLAQHNMKMRYFRHPFLDTGRDLSVRREAERFLVERGYRIAPITLDSWDWMYAGVYQDALNRKDTAMQQQLVQSFLSYSDTVFAYSEQLSVKIMGYEPSQILLLHASQFEADHIGELLDVMRKRGYRFIPLGDALSDAAYSLPDTYVGEEGTGWLDHWVITQGKPPLGAPEFPQWVIERSKILHQPQP
jgi:peptidoglycan/xylan/chitin deacetylase (PgdA/CDA1 family)